MTMITAFLSKNTEHLVTAGASVLALVLGVCNAGNCDALHSVWPDVAQCGTEVGADLLTEVSEVFGRTGEKLSDADREALKSMAISHGGDAVVCAASKLLESLTTQPRAARVDEGAPAPASDPQADRIRAFLAETGTAVK